MATLGSSDDDEETGIIGAPINDSSSSSSSSSDDDNDNLIPMIETGQPVDDGSDGQILVQVLNEGTAQGTWLSKGPWQEKLLVLLVFLLTLLYASTMLVVIPNWVDAVSNTSDFWVFFGSIAVLCLLFWSSFAQAALVDPGYIPADWWARPLRAGEQSPLLSKSIRHVSDQGPEPQEDYSYCGICSCWKPKRAHHCSRCNRCSLKFDHHCFYIGTCVGYRNQKYFYLLLVYATLSLLYFSAWTIIGWTGFAFQVEDGEDINIAFIVFMSLTTVGLCLQTPSLIYMLSLHTFLISKNVTNLEWVCCQGQKPACHFNRGTAFKNFQEVLGVNPLWWWLPVRTATQIDHRGFDYESTFVQEPV